MHLVLSTFPTEDQAREAARTLVEEGLIACANVLPPVRSIYRWQGAVCDEAEAIALLKCPAGGYPALERRLRELHPYELPEILAFEPVAGLTEYLAWADQAGHY